MRYLIVIAALGLGACANQGPAQPTPSGEDTTTSASEVTPAATPSTEGGLVAGAEKRGSKIVQDAGLVQTATQPLNDLNLLETRIPPVLTSAVQKGAYAEPADRSCPALVEEIKSLNEALGPDIDVVNPAGADPTLAEKAMDQAVDFVVQPAMNSVKNTVSYFIDGVLPFRSWVRRLSGAERVSNEVGAAISAGTTRRHFLKGWARASGCELPKLAPPPPAPPPSAAPVSDPAFNYPP